MNKKSKEMLSRIGKEIASEITEKKRDPEYKISLDKTDCVNSLSSILGMEYNEVSDMLESEINKYLRISSIF